MTAFEPDKKPKLKLELVRGGSGSGRKTAIATDDHGNNEPDYVLDPVPFWFRPILPFARGSVRRLIGSLSSHEERQALLIKSMLNRRYRVILAQRWKFPLDEDLSQSDARLLIGPSSSTMSSEDFRKFIRSIEDKAVWHIWRYWSQ